MAFFDIFVGVPQSKYAAYAIIASLIAVALAVMFGREEIPLGQKFSLVLIIFLVSLPSIFLTLFQMTCLVTGTGSGRNPWCGWYAWLISALTIVYSVLIITIVVISISTGGNALKELRLEKMDNMKENKEAANDLAKGYFEAGGDAREGFTDVPPPEEKKDDKKGDTAHFDTKYQASLPAPVVASPRAPETFVSENNTNEYFTDAPLKKSNFSNMDKFTAGKKQADFSNMEKFTAGKKQADFSNMNAVEPFDNMQDKTSGLSLAPLF